VEPFFKPVWLGIDGFYIAKGKDKGAKGDKVKFHTKKFAVFQLSGRNNVFQRVDCKVIILLWY
jgi:hypothetical protein